MYSCWAEQTDHVGLQINSIVVSIDLDWAPDNQDIIKALKEKYPYIEWRKDLPFDEIIVTAQ